MKPNQYDDDDSREHLLSYSNSIMLMKFDKKNVSYLFEEWVAAVFWLNLICSKDLFMFTSSEGVSSLLHWRPLTIPCFVSPPATDLTLHWGEKYENQNKTLTQLSVIIYQISSWVAQYPNNWIKYFFGTSHIYCIATLLVSNFQIKGNIAKTLKCNL